MKDLFRLDGKVAVVIGGAGIGQGIAEAMAFYGAEVVIASRKMESLVRAKSEIKEKVGKRCWPSTRWMPPMRTASLPWSTPW